MTPAQANQIAEYYHKLLLISGKEVATRVHREALAAGHDALRWAQSMPNVLNSWAWWDGVSGRFEQALTEAMAGRDPLGDMPVHHRWGVPLTAEHARRIDDAALQMCMLIGERPNLDLMEPINPWAPDTCIAMAEFLRRSIPQPEPPAMSSMAEIQAALAAILARPTATRQERRASRGRRA